MAIAEADASQCVVATMPIVPTSSGLVENMSGPYSAFNDNSNEHQASGTNPRHSVIRSASLNASVQLKYLAG
jgi:hypothetical protein